MAINNVFTQLHKYILKYCDSGPYRKRWLDFINVEIGLILIVCMILHSEVSV